MNTIDDNSPRRWDPIVKLTHWGVVAAVMGNALLTEDGSGWHIWVGYGLAGLLGLRLLWGLVGPREARFSAFPPSPARAIRHIGEIGRGEVTHHRSHNPLGALMVYAIWATLLAIVGSGIAMAGPPPADPNAIDGHEAREDGGESERAEANERRTAPQTELRDAREERGEREQEETGEESEERAEPKTGTDRDDRAGLTQANAPAPAAGAQELAAMSAPTLSRDEAGKREETQEGGEAGEDEAGEWLEELHEVAVNLLYVLIALHLLGVVFETRRSGRQIVGAMLPGGNRPA